MTVPTPGRIGKRYNPVVDVLFYFLGCLVLGLVVGTSLGALAVIVADWWERR